MSIKKSFIVLSSALLLIGCGENVETTTSEGGESGSSNKSAQAYYLDEGIEGVKYLCDNTKGYTGRGGVFKVIEGDDCSFYLNKIKIRDIYNVKNNQKIFETNITIARLLQSLDFDGNLKNGIQIDKEVVKYIKKLPLSDSELKKTLYEIKKKVKKFKGKYVSLEKAKEHLEKNIKPYKPVAYDLTVEFFTIAQKYKIPLKAYDPQNEPLKLIITKPPKYGIIKGTFPNIVYIPNKRGFVGEDYFKYKVTDGILESNEASVKIAIKAKVATNHPPIAADDFAKTQKNKSIYINVLANDKDPDGDKLQIIIVSSPKHGKVIVSNGKVKYIPNKDYVGEDVFAYKLNDGKTTSNIAYVHISVFENITSKLIAKNDSLTIKEDNPSYINVLANDNFDGKVNILITTQPKHGKIEIVENKIKYIPNKDYFGKDSFRYKLSNGKITSNEAVVNINILPVNDAPVAKNDLISVKENKKAVINVLANDYDPDGDKLKIVIVTYPKHGKVYISNGKIIYTPTSNYTGTDIIRYKLSDGKTYSNVAEVYINIVKSNQPPVAKDDFITITPNKSTYINVLANDYDPDGDKLQIILLSKPKHGKVYISNGKIKYIPNKDYTGEDEFTYQVSDGKLKSNVAHVYIKIQENNILSAKNDYVKIKEDTPTYINVLANDEINGDVKILITTKPKHGKIQIINNKIKYIPDENFNGADSFKYKLSNGKITSNEAVVNINVLPVNDAPIAKNDTITLNKNETRYIYVLANDYDPDGDKLKIIIVTYPKHGKITISSNKVKYIPNKDYTGEDEFTYQVSDGKLKSNIAHVYIKIKKDEDELIAVDDNIEVKEDSYKCIHPLINDPSYDPTYASLADIKYKIIITSPPKHGKASVVRDVDVKYVPDKDYFGKDSFRYKYTDGKHFSNEAVVNINVLPVNDAPVAKPFSVTVKENQSTTIILKASDVDSDNLTYYIKDYPQHGQLKGEPPKVIYIPDEDYTGYDVFTYYASDGELSSNIAEVNIKVISNTIAIDDEYKKVTLIEDGGKFSGKVELSSPKNLYVIFTNKSDKDLDISISHNATSKNENKVASFNYVQSPQYPQILPPPSYVTEFNNKNITNNNYMLKAMNYSVKTTSANVGDKEVFYLDVNATKKTTATLRKVVKNVKTKFGEKTLYVWVSDDAFGDGCKKKKCVTQELVNKVADKFLKPGMPNDIYDYVTAMVGEEWGEEANKKYSNYIKDDNSITILITDIDNDNKTNNTYSGYFWSKDNYYSIKGSNKRIMFYIDSVLLANGEYWEKEIYSTLAHEFQHMIHFYQRHVLRGLKTVAWYNEMMSLAVEDLMSEKLGVIGPRGVDPNDPTGGKPGNKYGRYPMFNEKNYLPINEWGKEANVLYEYAKVAAFSGFLLRNYNGAQLMHNLMVVNKPDSLEAVEKAVNTTMKTNYTYHQILNDWGCAIVLSDRYDLDNYLPKYNINDYFVSSINGVTYKIGSINLFNYTPTPKMFTTSGKINHKANYIYKIGENVSGSFNLKISVPEGVKATLIAK